MEIVQPLDENDIDSDLLEKIQFFKGPLGVIPSSVKTMSYHPKIADAFTNLNIAVMECKGSVTPEFKDLLDIYQVFFRMSLLPSSYNFREPNALEARKKD